MPRDGHYDFSKDEQNDDDFEDLGSVGRGLLGDHRIYASITSSVRRMLCSHSSR